MKQGKWMLILMIFIVGFTMIASALIIGKTARAVSSDAMLRKRQVVIIDPGHGGEDGGAISCTGRKESDLNLQISLRLRDLLNLIGIKVYMIRTADISIYTSGTSLAQKKISDLKERVRIINQTDHSLMLSIHQNSFPQQQYSGPQVFYRNPDSKIPAEKLQTMLNEYLKPNHPRSTKRSSGVYLMEHIDNVSLLTECGFISNYEEEALLHTKEYQLKLCCVLGSFCSNFLNKAKKA